MHPPLAFRLSGEGEKKSKSIGQLLWRTSHKAMIRCKRSQICLIGPEMIDQREFRQRLRGSPHQYREYECCEQERAHPLAPRPGQIGSYWLSKKPGRERAEDAWCRTWYDLRTRQTRRVSLGAADFREASLRLAAWVVASARSRKAPADQVLIDSVLLNYWDDHAQHLPSAKTQWLGLSYWQEFWTRRTVADITPDEQRRFREWLAKRGTGLSGIDRILSVGRAALNRARKWEEVGEVPPHFRHPNRRGEKSPRTEGTPRVS
jgi:hypothetical protein